MKKIIQQATLHDGSKIDIEISGNGPAILLPVNPLPMDGPQAESMRQWGVDPALGRNLIDGLNDTFTIVAFDYEGHRMAHPAPDTLTPENITKDFLIVADTARLDRFAYYGYSWLALSGLQLAIRTNRLTGLIMGGYSPLNGPYDKMLTVTTKTYEMAILPKKSPKTSPKQQASEEFDWSSVEVTMTQGQTKQFMTLYQALQQFDDNKIQSKISCPKLCFAGSADVFNYGEKWGNVQIKIADPLINHRADLGKFGWDVRLLEGLNHTQAMQVANVLPFIKPWFIEKLIK